jgi:thiamine-phosphate diphosphorylase
VTGNDIPRLHLISDRQSCPLDLFPQLAALAVAGGVDAVHLREKDVASGELLAAARALRDSIGTARFFVNDRVDIAMLSNASGVQLGEASISVADARELSRGRLLIGRSVHDLDGARRAYSDGADFIVAGHVFQTSSKAGQPARGLQFIEALVSVCPLPVIAIGGITPARVAQVIQSGAHGVAVQSGILRADEPREAARSYVAAMSR